MDYRIDQLRSLSEFRFYVPAYDNIEPIELATDAITSVVDVLEAEAAKLEAKLAKLEARQGARRRQTARKLADILTILEPLKARELEHLRRITDNLLGNDSNVHVS